MDRTQKARRELGKYLKKLRGVNQMSGREAAELATTDQSTISRAENGHIRPSHETLTRLLTAYGATPEEEKEAHRLWDRAQLPLPALRRQDGVSTGVSSSLTLRDGVSAAEEMIVYLCMADETDDPRYRERCLQHIDALKLQIDSAVLHARMQLRPDPPGEPADDQ